MQERGPVVCSWRDDRYYVNSVLQTFNQVGCLMEWMLSSVIDHITETRDRCEHRTYLLLPTTVKVRESEVLEPR